MGSAQLTGRVIFKGDPGYTQAVKNWNPYVDVCPLVFVFAQNSYDVSNAIKWAREKNVPLRVRSGRHALDKNLSTVSDGIVIDVSDMNNVFLDEKNAVATVQTGIHVGTCKRFSSGRFYTRSETVQPSESEESRWEADLECFHDRSA